MKILLNVLGILIYFLLRFMNREDKTKEPSVKFWIEDNWVELIVISLFDFALMIILIFGGLQVDFTKMIPAWPDWITLSGDYALSFLIGVIGAATGYIIIRKKIEYAKCPDKKSKNDDTKNGVIEGMNTALIIILVSIGLLINGCSPCLRLQKKCPPQVIKETRDSIITRDTIIYKDKEVKIKIPGDTVFKEKKVFIKEDISPLLVQNDYSTASAWVENSQLKLQLIQKERIVVSLIDSAMVETKHWIEKYYNDKQTVVVKERYVPKVYKYAFWTIIFEIIILISFFVLKKYWNVIKTFF
jgi:hypothetical protein